MLAWAPVHDIEQLLQPGGLSCWLIHDAGTAWPDAKGLALLQAALAEPDGAAARKFVRLVDDQMCFARLWAEQALWATPDSHSLPGENE